MRSRQHLDHCSFDMAWSIFSIVPIWHVCLIKFPTYFLRKPSWSVTIDLSDLCRSFHLISEIFTEYFIMHIFLVELLSFKMNSSAQFITVPFIWTSQFKYVRNCSTSLLYDFSPINQWSIPLTSEVYPYQTLSYTSVVCN